MTPSRPIRVVVADDSAFMRTAITRMIESDPELKVVATAQTGPEAIEKIEKFDPDVVTLDIEMPKLNGLGVLRHVMEHRPRPVIMISSLTQEGAEATLEAFDLGAFECIPKQLSRVSLDIVQIRQQLVSKIKAAASTAHYRPRPKLAPLPAARTAPRPSISHDIPPPALVAIGTSTGGPKALQELLPQLPDDLPAGIVMVQHMPQGFTAPFARRLNSMCRIEIREAINDEIITAGTALLAPAGLHMTVYRRTHTQYRVRLSPEPANTLHRPSVDVLMLSVAEVYGVLAMGVILTGMGGDGALGMKLLYEKGALTVGQDEASCVVYGMPRTCAEMGVLRRVAPLSHIPDEILAATRYKVHA